MDGRRPARAGAQNPAYRPARPPPTPLTCDTAEFKIGRGASGAHAVRAAVGPVAPRPRGGTRVRGRPRREYRPGHESGDPVGTWHGRRAYATGCRLVYSGDRAAVRQ